MKPKVHSHFLNSGNLSGWLDSIQLFSLLCSIKRDVSAPRPPNESGFERCAKP
jgi:hypothetical protein